MPLNIHPTEWSKLIENGQQTAAGVSHDPFPVLSLFVPGTGFRWLLSEIDPTNPDRAFGICDAGNGLPKLGRVSLRNIAVFNGVQGSKTTINREFQPTKSLSAYLADAENEGAIIL